MRQYIFRVFDQIRYSSDYISMITKCPFFDKASAAQFQGLLKGIILFLPNESEHLRWVYNFLFMILKIAANSPEKPKFAVDAN